MRPRDEEDVFRAPSAAPSVDQQLEGLGLFATASAPAPTVAEAEAEIRRDFLGQEQHEAPAALEREKDQTQAFGELGMTERQRQERIGRIQREIREPLLALANSRVDHAHGSAGVTAQDAREIAAARQLGHLLGTQQRAWSWLSPWLGQLAREGALVKYRIAGMVVRRAADNGNEQVVYLHPYDRRATAQGAA